MTYQDHHTAYQRECASGLPSALFGPATSGPMAPTSTSEATRSRNGSLTRCPGTNPGTGTAYHPTALPTVGPCALPVPGFVPGSGFASFGPATSEAIRSRNGSLTWFTV